MSFDAGVTSALAFELNEILGGAKIEKILQPSRDVVILSVHPKGLKSTSLLIDCGAANSRLCLTSSRPENPAVPPMFCMLLRKHLTGGRIISVKQPVFDRVFEIKSETHDELGYTAERFIYAEIMGRYSNLIFCDGDRRVIGAIRTSDIASEEKRPIYVGGYYSFPPRQEGKILPFGVGAEEFSKRTEGIPPEKACLSAFCGISPLVSREIAFISKTDGISLFDAFRQLIGRIENNSYSPCAIKNENGFVDFSFFPIRQYGGESVASGSMSETVDIFYTERSGEEAHDRKAASLHRLLLSAANRVSGKIGKQEKELEKCLEKDELKKRGELITANMYLLKKGMESAEVTDYEDPDMKTVTIQLDKRLSPSQNAQKCFRQYAKYKSAEENLKIQIEKSRGELDYIKSVQSSLKIAESENDFAEIRRELTDTGYLGKNFANVPKKIPETPPLRFRTSNGIPVLCGKNNRQNDKITFSLAGKHDIWFHIKGFAGSHVVLLCGDTEPDASDYTEAAEIAAAYSSAEHGQTVTVDYTRVKNVKKPPASPPGYVTFSSNWSAYVTADRKKTDLLKES